MVKCFQCLYELMDMYVMFLTNTSYMYVVLTHE
jgi:hypothetical protein